MDVNVSYGKVDQFIPNSWNPNIQSEFIAERTRRSIEKFGFVDPLTVRETDSEGVFEIIDGQHRWTEAKNLGLTEIPYVNLGKISDAVAKQLTIVLNETRGDFDTIKLSELLTDLKELLDYDTLLDDLPYTKETLDSLLELPDFDWDSFGGVDEEDDNEINEGANDEWVDMEFRVAKATSEIIESELDRLSDTINSKTKDEKIRRGLVLGEMAVRSASVKAITSESQTKEISNK